MKNIQVTNLEIEDNAIEQFDLLEETNTDRTVEEVLDVETGEILLANDIFENEESIILSMRKTLELARKSEILKFICPYCQQEVRISHRRLFSRQKTTYFFSHYPNSDDCPIKSENIKSLDEIMKNRINSTKESLVHKNLVQFISTTLKSEKSKSKGFDNVETYSIFKDTTVYDGWRKPDITAKHNSNKIVFELQLTNTFLSDIIERDSFYRMHKTYIIWVFSKFSPSQQRIVEKDLYYAHKRNVFVLDHKEYYQKEKETTFITENYKYAQDETLDRGELILRCYWQKPTVDIDNKVKIEWHHKLISIDELIFDEEKNEVYYYNSDADFYHQSDPEKQKIIDFWEAEKEKRWSKIFDNVELRKKRKQEWEKKREEREANLAEKQKTIKLLLKIRNGEINLEPFKDKDGNYGFTAFDPKLFDNPMIVIKPKYSEVTLFSNGIAFVRMANWGAIGITGKKIISFQYSSLSWIRDTDNILATDKKKKAGVIDIDEKTIIPFVYDEIQNFIAGKAIVNNNNKYGQIDEEGNEIIPFEYDLIKDFINGKAIAIKNNKYGQIDEEGNEIIPFEYDEIQNFIAGKAIAKKNESYSYSSNYGLIDENGNEIAPFEFDEIHNFVDGKAIAKKNNKFGQIDEEGNGIIPFKYDEIQDFIDGKAIAKKRNGYKFEYGLINENGNEVIPFEFDLIRNFIHGKAIARKNYKYGQIDEEGNEIIPFKYDEIQDFIDGKAIVRKNYKYGLIDHEGAEIFQNRIEYSDNVTKVEKHGFWGLENPNGDTIIPYEYDEIQEFIESKAIAKKKSKYGLFDINGNKIIPFIYDEIKKFINGKAIVKKGYKYGIINIYGEIIIPCIYDEVYNFSNGKALVYKFKWRKVYKNYNYRSNSYEFIVDEKHSQYIDEKGIFILNNRSEVKEGIYIGEIFNKWGILDAKGNTLIPFENDKITESFNSNFLIKKNGYFGIMDINGNVIIPFNYSEIQEFINDIAKAKKNNIYGHIDKCGNEIIQNKVEIAEGKYKGEKFGLWGIEDMNGKSIVPFEYDEIRNFNNEKAIAKKRSKYGLSDIKGAVVIPFEYDEINGFTKGKALAKKGGKYGYINEFGDTVISFEYVEIQKFIDGIAISKKGNESRYTHRYGIIDEKGNEITQFIYEEMQNFSNGIAKVRRLLKYGFLNNSGVEIIPLIYEEIGDFHNGKAKVKKNNKYGYIDIKNNEITQNKTDIAEGIFKGEKFGYWGIEDIEGNILATFEHSEIHDYIDGIAKAKKGFYYGIIDKKGIEKVPFIYSEIYNFINGIAKARKYPDYGCIDKNGNVLIPFIYQEIGIFVDGIAKARRNNIDGYIDEKGNEIIHTKTEITKDIFKGEKFGLYGVIDSSSNEIIPFKYQRIVSMNNALLAFSISSFKKYTVVSLKAEVVRCIITGIADFGVFLELSGIKGLLHINEINRAGMHIGTFSKGDYLDVFVSDADEGKNRLSFSILPNNQEFKSRPFEQKTIAINSVHVGVISRIENYGLFIRIRGVGTAMLHISELKKHRKNIFDYNINDEIEVKILHIDNEKNRVSLTL